MEKVTDRLYIVIPAYNEEENIGKVVEQWHPIAEGIGQGSRLVVIDDGSRDDTLAILRELEKQYPCLLVKTKPNSGHGPTLLVGYRFAVEEGAEYVFQTDSDGQTDPAEFDAFWELRKDCDAVIGSRPSRQDGASRVFVEKTLCRILRVVFGVKIPDANAPFRLMKTELLEKYLSRMPEDYNLPNVMLTTFFAYYNENIRFLDVSFKPRQGGTNSINLRKIVKIGWKALGDFERFKKEM